MKKEPKNESNEEIELELIPHHIIGYINHENYPEWYEFSDSEYISKFRGQKRDFHSDKVILHARDTVKKIHDNPSIKFKYVVGLDSICKECDQNPKCHDKKHWEYSEVQKADSEAMKKFPELEIGQAYSGRYLHNLLKKKGLLRKKKLQSFPV